MKELVELLIAKKLTIATMESCTGGALASSITNIEGSSEVLKFSAVTYSNLYKIKMGVSKDIIDKYSVYSIETANQMSKAIVDFTCADIGVGITGKINRSDINNPYGNDSKIYVSIYMNQKHYHLSLDAVNKSRKDNKEIIVDKVVSHLLNLLK